MRSFYILPLHFTTPVHFGSAGYGGGLEMAGMTCPADTLFSALCVEAVRLGGDALATLTAKAERGDSHSPISFPAGGKRESGSGTCQSPYFPCQ